MSKLTRTILKVTLWVFAIVIAIAAVFVYRLVHVDEPHPAASLNFKGFIPLPAGSTLNVLDYVTISDKRLFVTGESTGSVYKISLRGDGQLPQSSDVSEYAAEPSTHGVALNPTKTVAYVTRSEINAVDVFDPQSMKDIKRIPVADDPDGLLFDSLHNIVYVANGDAHLVTLIDPNSYKVLGKITLEGKPEFQALDAATGLIYQNLRDIHAVAAVDVTSRSVKASWDLAGCAEPSGMALDAVTRRLFIGCAGNARLVVFDLVSHRVSATVEIGPGPDSVAFDPVLHRIYTAGKGGVLTVVQQQGPDAYRVMDSVKLHYGAHTLGVDPATHRLYVAYASLLVAPRIAVFDPRT